MHGNRLVKRSVRFVLAAAFATLALPGNAPIVTIDYKSHESLWRAQRNLVSAYELIENAPETSKPVSQEHARRAQELLIEADRELRLVASSLRK